MQPPDSSSNLLQNLRTLIQEARQSIVQQINHTMVFTYYEIGRQIVEDEQGGKERAAYATQTIEQVSVRLTEEFGRGFSVKNLRLMRQFYLTYQKRQTLSAEFKLSWSHYTYLMRLKREEERQFYEIEAVQNQWSLRELKRQFDSALYERLLLSSDKDKVKELSIKGQVIEKASDAIKEPMVLEFLDLAPHPHYTEKELETAIIDKLEHFLLELGKGFTFVARQKRITFSGKHFHIDLVFYNRILKSFVLIDLKIGELTHEDLGQMQMYVNYYDREKRLEDENKTIGLVLCRLKENAIVKYTLPEDNEQIFASEYLTVLPDKEKLKKLISE